MTDDNLKKILDKRDIPELDDAARERIVSSAAIRYRHAARNFEPARARSPGEWLATAFKPAFAVAAALLLIVAVRNEWSGGGSLAPNTDRYNVAVFEEYQSLFQHELRAVVARNGDVDVVLGGQETAQANPIVFIRIEADGKPVYITAYSGQTIEAEIGGKKVKMDILTTADQDVLVASDEFMLENGVLYGPDNFSADAHVLEISL